MKPTKTVLDNPTIGQLAAKIAGMTDRNDHTGACLALAEYLGGNYPAVMKHIKDIHDVCGHMPYELGQYRNALRNEMMETFERKEGRAAAYEIYSSF